MVVNLRFFHPASWLSSFPNWQRRSIPCVRPRPSVVGRFEATNRPCLYEYQRGVTAFHADGRRQLVRAVSVCMYVGRKDGLDATWCLKARYARTSLSSSSQLEIERGEQGHAKRTFFRSTSRPALSINDSSDSSFLRLFFSPTLLFSVCPSS